MKHVLAVVFGGVIFVFGLLLLGLFWLHEQWETIPCVAGLICIIFGFLLAAIAHYKSAIADENSARTEKEAFFNFSWQFCGMGGLLAGSGLVEIVLAYLRSGPTPNIFGLVVFITGLFFLIIPVLCTITRKNS